MVESVTTRRTALKKIGALGVGGVLSTTAVSASHRRRVKIQPDNSASLSFEVWFTSSDVLPVGTAAESTSITTQEKNNHLYGVVDGTIESGEVATYSIPEESFVYLIRNGSNDLQFETGDTPDSTTESDVEFKSLSGNQTDYHVSVTGSISARDNCETGWFGSDYIVTDADGNERMNGRVSSGEDTWDISGQFTQMYLGADIQLERFA